jgi:signal transduction histidine kinase/ligand-binding sensor domain-containing protein
MPCYAMRSNINGNSDRVHTAQRGCRLAFPTAGCLVKWLFLLLCVTAWPRLLQSEEAVAYKFHTWNSQNGLPDDSIDAIQRTRDGYIWMTTSSGLVRFDGLHFRIFNEANTPALVSVNFTFGALLESRDGALWAGTSDGGALRYQGGRFSSIRSRDGLPDDDVARIDQDPTGAVYIFTRSGLSKWVNGKIERLAPKPGSPFNGYQPADPGQVGFDGKHWGIWRNAGSHLQRFANGSWSNFPLPPGMNDPLQLHIHSIYQDSRGTIWYNAGGYPGQYFRVQGEELRVFRGLPPEAFVCWQGDDGALWIDTHHGQVAIWKDGHLYPQPAITTPNLFNTIQDPGGALWIATLTEGLFRVTRPVAHLLVPDGAPEFPASLLLDKDRRVWLGSTALQYLDHQGVLRRFKQRRDNSADLTIISALAQQPDGSMLAASRNKVTRIDGLASRSIELPAGHYGDIDALLPSADGSLWFGSEEGLTQVGAGRFLHLVHPDGAQHATVTSIVRASNSDLWIGSSLGLSQLTVSNHRAAWRLVEGWRYGPVQSLLLGQRGVLWVGTDRNGLVRVDARSTTNYSTAAGLPDDTVAAMLETGTGEQAYLWLTTDRGLVRIAEKDLEAYAHGEAAAIPSIRLGEADGVPLRPTPGPGQSRALQDAKGQLLFSTHSGVVVFDPQAISIRRSPPRVYIESYRVDGTELQGTDAITLHPGQSNLEIDYTGITDGDPEELLFRYRLVGLDRQWTQAGTRRVALFSHLPPGNYHFEVEASSLAGFRSETTAAIPLSIVPRFYQRRSIQTLIGLLLLSAILGLTRLRHQNLLRSKTRQQAFARTLMASQEVERKRIAAELHDGLGQHLVLINNLSLMGSQASNRRADTGVLYERIAEQTSEAIDELRAISYNLRPYQLDRLGLTRAIQALSDQAREIFPGEWSEQIGDIDGAVEPELEIAFYRIVQECINNILKHAHATKASILLRRMNAHIKLEINDNGQGLPEASSAMIGFGMIGMRERAEALSGKLQMSVPEGGGTCVLVTVPVTEEPAAMMDPEPRTNADHGGAVIGYVEPPLD